MTTQAQVTEFVNAQWESGEDSSIDLYWYDQGRLSIVQNWMSPDIAVILQKVIGDAHMVSRLAQNRSNN